MKCTYLFGSASSSASLDKRDALSLSGVHPVIVA